MTETTGRKGDLQSQWARVRGKLREEVGDAAYRSWLRSMTLYGVDEGRVKIGVPTRFLRDWVSQHYADRIRALWNGENNAIASIEILVTGKTMAPAGRDRNRSRSGRGGYVVLPFDRAGRDERDMTEEKDISAPLDPRFTFENFVVGKPNELAHAAARRVAEAQVGASRHVPFNPLFLLAACDWTKTHLMHGIAWYIRTQAPDRKASTSRPKNSCSSSCAPSASRTRWRSSSAFRSVDVLMIDDVHSSA